ncbi:MULTISPECIES: DUF5635 domain-containing protein [Microbacterium]|uniref:DUF5635 domain-containing protein n=2 Tax=Microbacterium TaxID=33882 RepID=A0ABV3LJQ0_9MICO|nr:DUF5635 domain-containing protein [Microbacterium profundi]
MSESSDLVPFQPGTELLADRARAEDAVERCLAQIRTGALPDDVERQRVDIKEEAGRRGSGGRLLPGNRENTKAADHLADEIAAMANTPGGGALIVGIEDKAGDLLGTELDAEWLRQQIYRRIDIAPDVIERVEQGIRLLVLYVPEAREPVEDTSDRLRWRVGPASVPIDRGQWWLHRQGRAGWDPMSRPSSLTTHHVTPGAIAVARGYLGRRDLKDASATDIADASTEDMLRQLGLLTVEGFLTEAGALLFCAAPRPWLSWTRLDVEGGDVLAREESFQGVSLLEQVARVEALMDAANDRVTIAGEFAERVVRLIPTRAAREAILNGIVHRDWNQHAPTTVTWVEEDYSLTVVSPGGFVGGVTADNLLTQRFSRSPALADAALALGLVDKQGIGVDRMYREMVALGHQPPRIIEDSGPRVRARLVGGAPVVPIMRLTTRLQPAARQRDVQVALVIHALLHNPFTTATEMATLLQRSASEAAEALETTAMCVLDAQPIIESHKDVWVLSAMSRKAVLSGVADAAGLKRRGVLWYVGPSADDARTIVRRWLDHHDRITSGDFAVLTGMTPQGARGALERLEGDLLARGDAAGRNAHFVLR